MTPPPPGLPETGLPAGERRTGREGRNSPSSTHCPDPVRIMLKLLKIAPSIPGISAGSSEEAVLAFASGEGAPGMAHAPRGPSRGVPHGASSAPEPLVSGLGRDARPGSGLAVIRLAVDGPETVETHLVLPAWGLAFLYRHVGTQEERPQSRHHLPDGAEGLSREARRVASHTEGGVPLTGCAVAVGPGSPSSLCCPRAVWLTYLHLSFVISNRRGLD